MHAEAFQWVAKHVPAVGADENWAMISVLDIGGRNINGTVRGLFPLADVYTALDIADSPEVDVVADAATWVPDREYDVVVCCEVFEHTDSWPDIVGTAFKACRPGGLFIATMAGPGRPEHSAVDGQFRLHPGEYYGNVDPFELSEVLRVWGWTNVIVDQQMSPADVRAVATKPGADRGDA